jgi:hypothetical protein
LSDIPGVRKAARVNDFWELRTTAKELIRAHLDSCYAADPVTGVLEFVEQLVDARKLKLYWEMVAKANRSIMIETGQQPQPAPGLPANVMLAGPGRFV